MKKINKALVLLAGIVLLGGCGNKTNEIKQPQLDTEVEKLETTVVVEDTTEASINQTKDYEVVDFDVPEGECYTVIFYEQNGTRTETYYMDTTVVVIAKEYNTEDAALEKYQVLSQLYTELPAKSDYGVVKDIKIEGNTVSFTENRVLYDSFTKDGILEYANSSGGMLTDRN